MQIGLPRLPLLRGWCVFLACRSRSTNDPHRSLRARASVQMRYLSRDSAVLHLCQADASVGRGQPEAATRAACSATVTTATSASTATITTTTVVSHRHSNGALCTPMRNMHATPVLTRARRSAKGEKTSASLAAVSSQSLQRYSRRRDEGTHKHTLVFVRRKKSAPHEKKGMGHLGKGDHHTPNKKHKRHQQQNQRRQPYQQQLSDAGSGSTHSSTAYASDTRTAAPRPSIIPIPSSAPPAEELTLSTPPLLDDGQGLPTTAGAAAVRCAAKAVGAASNEDHAQSSSTSALLFAREMAVNRSTNVAAAPAAINAARPADNRKLRKLLHVHGTIRRNYRALQHSPRVFASMCDLCLGALDESRLLQCLANAHHTTSDDLMPSETVMLRVVAGSHQDSALAAAQAQAAPASLTARLPLSFVRWLNTPLTLPDLPLRLFLANDTDPHSTQKGSDTAAAANAAKLAETERSSSTACIDTAMNTTRKEQAAHVWEAHCRALGLTDAVVAVIEEALGITSNLSLSTSTGSGASVSTPRKRKRQTWSGARERDESTSRPWHTSLVSLEAVALLHPLLQSVCFFKWIKDEDRVKSSTRTKSTNAGGDGVDGRGHDSDSTLPSASRSVAARLERIRSCLCELQALEEARSGPAAGEDRLELVKRQLKPTQEVLKQSLAILNMIPKVDQCCVLEVDTPPSQEAKSAATTLPVYTAHILDLYLALFLRYILAAWPQLERSLQSTSLFWILSQPWYRTDIAGSAASWLTFWESCRPLSLYTSCDHDELSTVSATPKGTLIESIDYSSYVQNMRALCWPTVLDRRCAIAQRVIAMPEAVPSPSTNSNNSCSDIKTGAAATSTEGSLANVPRATDSTNARMKGLREGGNDAASQSMTLLSIKELATVLYSSERKQRLAYELMYVLFFRLRCDLAKVSAASPANSRSLSPSPSLRATSPQIHSLFDPRTVSRLAIHVFDVDRFVSERFFDKFHRPHRWLLELTTLSTSSDDDDGSLIPALQAELSGQSREPHMLTRALLPMLCVSLSSQLANLPPKRGELLYEAVVFALAEPCRHAFAFSTVSRGGEVRDAASLEAAVTGWIAMVNPLLPSLGEKPFQRFLWLRLLQHVKELVTPTTTPKATPFQGQDIIATENATGDRTGDAGHSFKHCRHNRQSQDGRNALSAPRQRVRELLGLGYFSALLLTAPSTLPSVRHDKDERPSPSRGKANDNACRESDKFAQTISQRFARALLSLMASFASEEGTTCSAGQPPSTSSSSPSNSAAFGLVEEEVLACWPRALSEKELASLPASMARCHRHLTTLIFSPTLEQEVRGWVAQRRQAQTCKDALGLSDPILRRWYDLLQEEELGLRPFPLTRGMLYEGLCEVMLRRAPALVYDAPFETVRGSSDAEATKNANADATATEALTSFPVGDLVVLLRVLSAVLARSGLSTLYPDPTTTATSYRSNGPVLHPADTPHLPPILESTASVAIRAAAGGIETDAKPKDGSSVEGSNACTKASTSTPAGGSPDGGMQRASTAGNARQRLHIFHQLLLASMTAQLDVLPLSAKLDALYLGFVPLEMVAHSVVPVAERGEEGERGGSGPLTAALDGKRSRSEAAAPARSWTDALRREMDASRCHAAFTCELILMRYATSLPFTSLAEPHPIVGVSGHTASGSSPGMAVTSTVTARFMEGLLQAAVWSEAAAAGDELLRWQKEREAPRCDDTGVSSHAGPRARSSSVDGPTQEEPRLITVAEHARAVARAHTIAAGVLAACNAPRRPANVATSVPSRSSSVGVSQASVIELPDDATLLALLLFFVERALVNAPARGHSEELLLWLSSAALVMQQRWHGSLAAAPPEAPPSLKSASESISRNCDTPLSETGATAASKASASSSSPTSHSAAPPLRHVLEAATPWCLTGTTSTNVQDTLACSQPHEGVAEERLVLLRQWLQHVLSRLCPLVASSTSMGYGSSLAHSTTREGGRFAFHHTAYAAVAMRTLQEIGVPTPPAFTTIAGHNIIRAVQSRRLSQRKPHLLFAAVAAQGPPLTQPVVVTGLLALAVHIREGRDLLSVADVHEALLLMRAAVGREHASPATGAGHLSGGGDGMAGNGGLQQPPHGVSRRVASMPLSVTATSGPHSTEHRDPSAGGKGNSEHAPVPEEVTVTRPLLLSRRSQAPHMRATWGVLAQRLLDLAAALTTEKSSSADSGEWARIRAAMVLALECGARMGCVDTGKFERVLLLTVLGGPSEGRSERNPQPSAAVSVLRDGLTLSEWPVVVAACGTAQGGAREDMAIFLKEPLLRLVEMGREQPLALLGLDATVTAAAAGFSEDQTGSTSLIAMREAAKGLCLLLESVPALYIESSSFWQRFYALVEACSECLAASAARLLPDEAAFWTEEWTQSYNWAVLTAGHPSLLVVGPTIVERPG